ncbi:MAG: hypothetical protein GXP27_02505 [Planctomycetes bacterium]|nr:hypothetical protein [Planctomycetota bacterium]
MRFRKAIERSSAQTHLAFSNRPLAPTTLLIATLRLTARPERHFPDSTPPNQKVRDEKTQSRLRPATVHAVKDAVPIGNRGRWPRTHGPALSNVLRLFACPDASSVGHGEELGLSLETAKCFRLTWVIRPDGFVPASARSAENPRTARCGQGGLFQGFASLTDLLSKSIQLHDGDFPKIQNNCQNRRNRYNLSDPCDRND